MDLAQTGPSLQYWDTGRAKMHRDEARNEVLTAKPLVDTWDGQLLLGLSVSIAQAYTIHNQITSFNVCKWARVLL